MKKRVSIFFAVILCLAMVFSVSTLTSAATVTATLGRQSVSSSYTGEIEIPITWSGIPEDHPAYIGIDIQFSFDKTKLEFQEVKSGDLTTTKGSKVEYTATSKDRANELGVVAAKWAGTYKEGDADNTNALTADSLKANGTVLVAVFKKDASFTSGSTPITFTENILQTGDKEGKVRVDFDVVDGEVNIARSGGSSGGSYYTPTPTPTATPTPTPTPTPTGITDGKDHFEDLDGYSWAEDAIDTITKDGIMVGISDTKFGPGLGIKRGDITLMVVRMFGINAEPGEQFSDVPADKYYADAIARARTHGVGKGYGDNIYLPEQVVTRQEMVAFCYRALEIEGKLPQNVDVDAQLSKFVDADQVHDYAKESMATFISMGIIKGRAADMIVPQDNITRAEAAVIFDRLAKYIAEN